MRKKITDRRANLKTNISVNMFKDAKTEDELANYLRYHRIGVHPNKYQSENNKHKATQQTFKLLKAANEAKKRIANASWDEYLYSQFRTYVERKGQGHILAHIAKRGTIHPSSIVFGLKYYLERNIRYNPKKRPSSDEAIFKDAAEFVIEWAQKKINMELKWPSTPPSNKKRTCDVSMLARFNAYVNYLKSSPKKLVRVGSDFWRHAEALVRCNIRNTSYVVKRMHEFFKDPEVSPRLKAGLFLSVAYFIAQYAGFKVYLKWRQSIEKQSLNNRTNYWLNDY